MNKRLVMVSQTDNTLSTDNNNNNNTGHIEDT